MKAVAVFPERHFVGLVEHPEPSISAPGEVKLRMLEVGVCGTDRDLANFEYGTAPPGSDYFVLGHESLAEAIEAGPAVERIRPGDLIVSMVRQPCPHDFCLACRSARQDFCMTGDYREHGIKDLHGFMTEFVVEQERYLLVVPRELRDVAVLIEPLTIAEKAFLQAGAVRRRLPWNQTARAAVVLGAGPVGLLGAMALVQAGFQTYVYSRGRVPNYKAEVAEAIGASYVSSEETPAEELAKRVGNIDLIYEAMGAPQVAFDVLRYLGANGVFVFTGIPPREPPLRLDPPVIVRHMVLKNQAVLGTVNAGRDAFEAAIRDLDCFMARWPDAVRALITGRYPLEEFHDPVYGRAGGIKNIIAL